MARDWPLHRWRRIATLPYEPRTGIEEAQGPSYQAAPGIDARLQQPLDPGINLPGFENPYTTVTFNVGALSTTVPVRALAGNHRRSYLLIQNKGPGNLFVGIGIDPAADGANVLSLVSTQVYEQIGGGGQFPDGSSYPTAFVSKEYISLLTDLAATTAMIIEGSYYPPSLSKTFRVRV